MLTTTQKNRVADAIVKKEPSYSSAARFAVVLGINASQLSRIKSGDIDKVLSDAVWITIARHLGVDLNDKVTIKAGKTPVFMYITSQLRQCQEGSLCGLLCDAADIGKTFAGKYYADNNKNAVYIDCSQTKTKQQLIRTIAREFGLSDKGRYIDVYRDLTLYLQTAETPFIILDEAGDLEYSAFLEIKALWNATEYSCGWYMMGADALKAKIEDNIGRKKLGYSEIFSRFGSRYQRITPDGDGASKDFAREQTAIVAKANGITDIQSLFAATGGSMRRIRFEINKLNNAV